MTREGGPARGPASPNTAPTPSPAHREDISVAIAVYVLYLLPFFITPLVGLILAPLAEQSMRQALTISQGEWSTFVTRPLSATLLAIAVALAVAPALWRRLRSPG